jgi:hypothetical protein
LAITLVLMGGVAIASCSSDDSSDDKSITSAELNESECGAAFVDFVTVETTDDGPVAVAQGHYPSVCDELGQLAQDVDGRAIVITVCSTRPDDVACAQQLTPFTETLPINTQGLEPGTYTIQVNGATTDADGDPAILTID